MLKFCVLASSSSGNSIFVGTEKTRILIDAGLSRRETTARLAAIGESVDGLDAVVITHEHCDHVAGLAVLMRYLNGKNQRQRPVFCTTLTATMLDWNEIPAACEKFQAGMAFCIGDLEIASFTIPHDSIDPVGFTVKAGGIRASIVTDLGYVPDSVKMHLRGTDLLMLESNHNLEMLKVGPYPWSIKQRIMGRKGHLSNDAAFEFITRDMDTSVSTLVLGHLSENTNYPSLVEQMVEQAVGANMFRPKTHVANPGKPLEPIVY